jgi:NifB/MoaA-like Fe-S oxidoreductase
MGSVSIVPAGLTRFRDSLPKLELFTPEECREVIRQITEFGDRCLAECGSRIFFPADEFYVKGGVELPDEDFYEGYPQIENGVGMLRSFESEFGFGLEDLASRLSEVRLPRRVSVATGYAAKDYIEKMSRTLMAAIPGLTVTVYPIVNRFFGESITVSGLLTGKDMKEQLLGKDLGEALYIPCNTLRADGDLFLCGMTPEELSDALGVPVVPAPNEGDAWIMTLLGL